MFPPKSPTWTQILMASMQGKAKLTTAKRRHIRRIRLPVWLHLSFSFWKIWPQESLESHSVRKDYVWLQMIRHMTNSGLNIPSVTRNLEVDSITMSPVTPRTQTSFCSTLLFPWLKDSCFHARNHFLSVSSQKRKSDKGPTAQGHETQASLSVTSLFALWAMHAFLWPGERPELSPHCEGVRGVVLCWHMAVPAKIWSFFGRWEGIRILSSQFTV